MEFGEFSIKISHTNYSLKFIALRTLRRRVWSSTKRHSTRKFHKWSSTLRTMCYSKHSWALSEFSLFSFNCFRWCPMHKKITNRKNLCVCSLFSSNSLTIIIETFFLLSLSCGYLNILIIDFHFTCFLSSLSVRVRSVKKRKENHHWRQLTLYCTFFFLWLAREKTQR